MSWGFKYLLKKLSRNINHQETAPLLPSKACIKVVLTVALSVKRK